MEKEILNNNSNEIKIEENNPSQNISEEKSNEKIKKKEVKMLNIIIDSEEEDNNNNIIEEKEEEKEKEKESLNENNEKNEENEEKVIISENIVSQKEEDKEETFINKEKEEEKEKNEDNKKEGENKEQNEGNIIIENKEDFNLKEDININEVKNEEISKEKIEKKENENIEEKEKEDEIININKDKIEEKNNIIENNEDKDNNEKVNEINNNNIEKNELEEKVNNIPESKEIKIILSEEIKDNDINNINKKDEDINKINENKEEKKEEEKEIKIENKEKEIIIQKEKIDNNEEDKEENKNIIIEKNDEKETENKKDQQNENEVNKIEDQNKNEEKKIEIKEDITINNSSNQNKINEIKNNNIINENNKINKKIDLKVDLHEIYYEPEEFNIIQEYLKMNYKDFYLEKHFCDYNSGSEWRAGFITNLSDDFALIIDATKKSDKGENLKKMKINLKDSKNISYFRKYSKPDNYMVKGASRNLQKKLEEFINFHKDFQNSIKNCESFDFYYFLRVSVYYGLDFCMNPNINKNNKNNNIEISFRLILAILDIIVDCLRFIEDNLNEFINYESNVKNTDLNDLVLVNQKYAIFSFFDDIHFLIKKIFGDSIQYLDWYIKFKNEINQFNPCANEIPESSYLPFYKSQMKGIGNIIRENINNEILERICYPEIYNNKLHIFNTLDHEISSCIISYFTDYFSYIGGYKILFRLIYSIHNFKLENVNIIINIQNSLIDDLFTAKAITDTFYNSHQEEIKKLKKYAINYLDKFDEQNFEIIETIGLSKFCDRIFDLIEKGNENKDILNENFKINYIFRQIQFSKKLDKRISFLSDLNKIIKSLEYNDLYKKIREGKNPELSEEKLNDKEFQERNKDIKKMNTEYFCKICNEKKIVNIFLDDNSMHEEIIKRLAPLLRLMYTNNYGFDINEKEEINKITINLFEKLIKKLKESERSNENLWKIIEEMIINFTEILNKEDKYFVFTKLTDYLNESFKTSSKILQIFSFIINYSLKCISKHKDENETTVINLDDYEKILKEDFNEKDFYCLNILIHFALDDKKINELKIKKEQKLDLIKIYNSGIIDILKLINFDDKILKIILTKIIIGIATSKNTVQNIFLLENIININEKNTKMRKGIKQLCERRNVIKSLIDKFYLYYNEIESLLQENEIKTDEIKSNEELYDYKTHLEKRLNFIFILLNKENDIKIDFEEFTKFFTNLSLNNNITKEIFYSIITNHILNFDDKLRKNIFDNILLNEKIFKINDLISFKLLKVFIVELNKSSNIFKYVYENDIIVDNNNNKNEIYGLDILWDILIKNEDKEIQNHIADFLKNIILGIRFSKMDKYEEFYNQIINKLIENLKKSNEKNKNNNNAIKGLVTLLKKIIDESINDGDIIQDKLMIDKLLDNLGKGYNENNKELNNKSNEEIKISLEYFNKTINKSSLEKFKCTIFNDIYFYQLQYLLSYTFKIPLRCVGLEFEYEETINPKDKHRNEIKKLALNLYNDLVNLYTLLLNVKGNSTKNTKKEEICFSIKVEKINNPLNNEKINIKNMINSNEELQKMLTNLLKIKNVDYTKDIWDIIKDKDDFAKNEKGIFYNFSELINDTHNEKKELLNDIFNFDDTSLVYKNFVLACLYKYLFSNNVQFQKDIIQKFIKSKIWIEEIKNLIEEFNVKTNDENKINQKINELIDDQNFIYNLLKIMKIISINSSDNEVVEFLINGIFNIYYCLIKDCINIDFNSFKKDKSNDIENNIFEIKTIYLKFLNEINELFKDNNNVTKTFFKLIIKEDEIEFNENKNEFYEKVKFCFIDGILKNNYPFLNEKASQLILFILKNKCFDETNQNEIKTLQKNAYKCISSIFFSNESIEKEYQTIKELFNINDNNKTNIYEYNIKLYGKILGEIIYNIYKFSYDEYNYEKYIIENVVPYIFGPFIKDVKKESNIHDLYFGVKCNIFYNYIQVMDNNKNIEKEIYNSIFNYKGKNLKKYLFNEVIMYKCDKDEITIDDNFIKGNFKKIIYSLKEANHLFISILMKEIDEDDNNNNIKGNDLMHYLEKINHFNMLSYWKGDSISDWKLNYREEINTTSFIGLKNLGCTCYMNSLLQVFYHIIPFRESLLKCNCKEEKKNSLCEVKKLFNSLKYINDSFYYTPNSFVNNFDDEILNVHQQMDVDEFFADILNKLEKRLKKSENENLIKYFFQGRLNDNLIFQEGCMHHRTNVNDFYSIQLQVKNKKNINESLDTLLEGELMNGDNCIYCSQCDKKFPAIKNQCFKILPRILMFVLKRFEFNYDTNRKLKINDYYEFPIELDMNKYTNEYIYNKNDKQNNKYTLKSIVIHQGNSEGGHYYAFIKDNESKEWYKFNDTKVNKFDINELANEAFGGKEEKSQFEKNRNAYLLFYEKIDDSNCETFNNIKSINILNKKNEDDDNDDFNLLDDNKDKNNNENNLDENSKQMIKNISEESVINNLNKKLFSDEYHHFTLELYINILNKIDFGKNLLPFLFECAFININDNHPFQTELNRLYRDIKPKGTNLSKYFKKGNIKIFEDNNKISKKQSEEEKEVKITELFKYILINFFNIIIRSKENKYFGCYVDLMKILVTSYDFCANYLIEEFSCYNVILEYLINCPIYNIKKVIVGIISSAMNKSIQSFQNKKGMKYNKKESEEGKKNKEINNYNEIIENQKNEILNDPKYNKIRKNDKKIKQLKKEQEKLNKQSINDFEILSPDDFGFETFTKEEIDQVKPPNKGFEIIDTKNLEEENNDNNKQPMGTSYLDIITENDNDSIHEKSFMYEAENDKNYKYKDERYRQNNRTLLENNDISPNVVKLIYNVIYVMRNIHFSCRNENRFLCSLLLQFSIISKKTREFLIKNIKLKLLLNILLFEGCRKNNYNNREVVYIDKGEFKTSHQILNSNTNGIILGENDKVGQYIILNNDYLLLCNLSYEEEMSQDELIKKNEDIGYSFYNKKYIEELIKFATTKQDINYLSNLIRKKCHNNKTVFDKVLDKLIYILERINDSEVAFYDKLEEEKNNDIFKQSNNLLKRLRNNIDIIFKAIIFDKNDENYDYKFKHSINKLHSLFKEYSEYYGLSISIINIIINIFLEANKISDKNQKILNEISDWLKKNKIPPKLKNMKGIRMYRDQDIFVNIYGKREVKKDVYEQFEKEEIKKTNKKLNIIEKILNGTINEKDISDYNCDLTDFKFTIGDQVIYDNKDYVITDCLDELIKIKLIDNDKNKTENEFKAKGFREKKINISEKDKKHFWIEKDNNSLRIKKLIDYIN